MEEMCVHFERGKSETIKWPNGLKKKNCADIEKWEREWDTKIESRNMCERENETRIRVFFIIYVVLKRLHVINNITKNTLAPLQIQHTLSNCMHTREIHKNRLSLW